MLLVYVLGFDSFKVILLISNGSLLNYGISNKASFKRWGILW